MRILAGLIITTALSVAAQDTAEAHVAVARAAAGTDFVNLLEFQCFGPGPGGARGGAGRGGAGAAGRGGAGAAKGAVAAAQGKGGPGGRGPAAGGGAPGVAGPAGGGRGRGPAGPPDVSTYYREPVKVFDNLYWFGQSEYSAWAITTSDGIILIDTLFDYSVEPEVVDGMRKLGLDPAQIKVAIVSHPHPDHDGGAKYLQDHFGTKVWMSPADWAVIDARTNGTKPAHDQEAKDGQKLTLGDTTITLYVTPGHTPGTLSVVFPVKDGSATHTAALWGGVGLNADRNTVETYVASAKRFSQIARDAGADIVLSNHTDWDQSKVNLPAIAAARSAGRTLSPNPYVVGNTKVLSFMKVAEECATSRIVN